MFGLTVQCSYHSISTRSRQVRHGVSSVGKNSDLCSPTFIKYCMQYDVILKHCSLIIWRTKNMILIRSRVQIYVYIMMSLSCKTNFNHYIEASHRTSQRIRCYTYLYTTVGYLVINTKMTDIPSSHCRRHPRWRHVTEALSAHQGPVLLTLLRHVARILANGRAAFFESCDAIGWNSCDVSQKR